MQIPHLKQVLLFLPSQNAQPVSMVQTANSNAHARMMDAVTAWLVAANVRMASTVNAVNMVSQLLFSFPPPPA